MTDLKVDHDMSIELKVDKDVPMPRRRVKNTHSESVRIAMSKMEVGDSYFDPAYKQTSSRALATLVAQSLGYMISTSRVIENGKEGIRVWRVQ